jgi:diguanylate cyclase
VRDRVDDPLDEAAVRCFADVVKVMGLTTVAEFVDKPAVLARLLEMHVDFAQGYLLHEPAPIAHLIDEAAPMPSPAQAFAATVFAKGQHPRNRPRPWVG